MSRINMSKTTTDGDFDPGLAVAFQAAAAMKSSASRLTKPIRYAPFKLPNSLVASCFLLFVSLALVFTASAQAAEKPGFAPRPDEQQLPRAMHSQMKDRPTITVGLRDADIIGADNRALQAAVEYIAGLGGGVVEIGAG